MDEGTVVEVKLLEGEYLQRVTYDRNSAIRFVALTTSLARTFHVGSIDSDNERAIENKNGDELRYIHHNEDVPICDLSAILSAPHPDDTTREVEQRTSNASDSNRKDATGPTILLNDVLTKQNLCFVVSMCGVAMLPCMVSS